MRRYLLLLITLACLTQCVRRVCVLDDREEEVSSGVNLSRTFFFDSYDQDGDKNIDFQEFRERMSIKFAYFDTDKNGKIDLGKECRDNNWCKPALTAGKFSLTVGQFLDEAVKRFHDADKSQDAKLDRREFSHLPNQ
ncbi:MAG: hypothetical protein HYR96_12420 [Deltaproteobacteria bacterium]|nr:hypothetical protein [Deltaproteobacteria bacterium]MBI3296138.1 hypothetical protein [Deltaproteobacteria bacterium]